MPIKKWSKPKPTVRQLLEKQWRDKQLGNNYKKAKWAIKDDQLVTRKS